MHNVLIVKKLESVQGLLDYLDRLLLGKSDSIQCTVQIFADQMLLDDEKVLPILEDVVHSDYVRMSGVHQNTEFVDQKVI